MLIFMHFILISSILILRQVSAENQFTASITCYTQVEREQVISSKNNMTVANGYHRAHMTHFITPDRELCLEVGCACFSFKDVCAEPIPGVSYYPPCTVQEIQQRTIKWRRGWTSIVKCENMLRDTSKFKELTCCHTNKCNDQEDVILFDVDSQTKVHLDSPQDHHQAYSPQIVSSTPSQWYDNQAAHQPNPPHRVDIYQPSQTYYTATAPSKTTRLPKSSKSSPRYIPATHNSTAPNVPIATLANEVQDKALSANNAAISSSLLRPMIVVSLLVYFSFFL